MAKKKKDKRTNNDLQSIKHKTKDRVTRILLKLKLLLLVTGQQTVNSISELSLPCAPGYL